MDQYRLRVEKVVGVAGHDGWSQVVSKIMEDEGVLALVSLKYKGDSDLLDLSQIGTSILESLVSKARVSKTGEELSKLIESSIDLDHNIQSEIGVVCYEKNNLRAVALGAQVYLQRQDKLGLIQSGDGQSVIGKTQLGDFVVLTTSMTPKVVGESKWQELLLKKSGGIPLTTVIIHEQKDSSQMALVCGEVEQAKKEKVQKFANSQLLTRLKGLIKRPLMVRKEMPKTNLWVGVGLIILLLAGMTMGLLKRSAVVKEREYKNLSESVSQKITEASSVGDLNSERANYLLNQAKSQIEQYVADTKDETDQEKAKGLLTDIDNARVKIFHQESVETNTLMELSLLDSGLKPNRMVMDDDGNVLITDSSSEKLFGVNLDDRSSWVEQGGGQYLDIAQYDGEIYGLKNDGVYLLPEKPKKGEESVAVRKVIEPDDLWLSPGFIDVYGGNVYVLDKEQGEVWKYPVLTDGYGERRRWFGAGIELDLTNVADMFIDGDVWIVTSTGKLERYSRGVPVTFSMEGFPYAERERLSGPSSVYVTDSTVYVLESGAGRVVSFDIESGKYQKQYVNETLKEGKSLVVHDNKVYVMTGDKLVWFTL